MNRTTKQYTSQVSTPYRPTTTQVQEPNSVLPPVPTGFSDKTMWDWLILFGTLAVPIVVLCATIVFSIQQDQANEAQHNNELRIAEANRQNDLRMAGDQQEENTLGAYLDGITSLLLDNRSGSPEISIVARAKTMIALNRLNNPHRKAMVIQFLYEAHLIRGKQPLVSLAGVALNGIDLRSTDLKNVDLSGTNLSGALLMGADLSNANLSGADLSNANLSRADLSNANLNGARITNGQLQQTKAH